MAVPRPEMTLPITMASLEPDMFAKLEWRKERCGTNGSMGADCVLEDD
jgi:hypothetical protein